MGKPRGPCVLASRKLPSVGRRGQGQVKARRRAQLPGGPYLPQAVVRDPRARSFPVSHVIPGSPLGYSEMRVRRDRAKGQGLKGGRIGRGATRGLEKEPREVMRFILLPSGW